jgi:hypothetical protein
VGKISSSGSELRELRFRDSTQAAANGLLPSYGVALPASLRHAAFSGGGSSQAHVHYMEFLEVRPDAEICN